MLDATILWPKTVDMSFEFTLVLDRVPTDDELDALFDAGCSDAIFEPDASGSLGIAHFARNSTSLTAAISEAVHNVESAGLKVDEVRKDDVGEPSQAMEYAREIAAANFMVAARAFHAR